MLRITVVLVIVIVASIECRAQKNIPQDSDTTKYWRIQTNDDNEFVGRILKTEGGVITLQTDKFGTITIRFVDIKSIEEADPKKIVGDQYWADNFQSTRYFFMPNGYGLKPGEGYYQNVWIMFNQFTVGVSNNFSISAGTIPIFLFGADVVPFWLNGKISVPLGEKVHLGTGVLYASAFGGDADGSGGFGVAYGVMTFGSRDKNASLGVGYGFSRGDFSKRPVISFSTMTRLGPRSYLMTENYLFGAGDSEAFGLLSIGGRRLFNKVGLDFGGFIPVGGGIERLITIPWLGLSAPLGKRYSVK